MTDKFIVTPDDVEEVLIKNRIKATEDLIMEAYYSLDYDMIENAPIYSQIDDQFEAIEKAKIEIEIQLKENGFLNSYRNNENQAFPDYSNVFERLNLFKNEEENWDGYGGKPASEETSKEVFIFLNYARELKLKEPGLCMGNDGRVGVVWCNEEIYLACDFCGDNIFTFIISRNEELLSSGYCSIENINKELVEFLLKNFSHI